MENKTEINKKIAKLLGFKSYGIELCEYGTGKVFDIDPAWDYPIDNELKSQRAQSPEHYIPDFVGVIMNAIEANKLLGGLGMLPIDCNSQPTKEEIRRG